MKTLMNTGCILQVEDEETDVMLLQHVFEMTGITLPLLSVSDGQMAIDYLSGVGIYADRDRYPLPCLVLLDLNLPLRGGFDVLRWIRQHSVLKKLVVVVFSSSSLPQDITEAYELGANSYIGKPSEIQALLEMAQLLKGWWLVFNQFAPLDGATKNPSDRGS